MMICFTTTLFLLVAFLTGTVSSATGDVNNTATGTEKAKTFKQCRNRMRAAGRGPCCAKLRAGDFCGRGQDCFNLKGRLPRRCPNGRDCYTWCSECYVQKNGACGPYKPKSACWKKSKVSLPVKRCFVDVMKDHCSRKIYRNRDKGRTKKRFAKFLTNVCRPGDPRAVLPWW